MSHPKSIISFFTLMIKMSLGFSFWIFFKKNNALFNKTIIRSFHHVPVTDSKEIIFYIHGWQRSLRSLEQESNRTFISALEKQGYIFQNLTWHEEAYSFDVREAQHRIWANEGDFINRLADKVHTTLKEYPNRPFRLVGYSLGNQVALRLTQTLLSDHPFNQRFWPKRLALLEPAFVKKWTYKDSGADNSLSRSMALLRDFHDKGIAIEVYRSSLITRTNFIGYSNTRLIEELPFPSIDINYNLKDTFNAIMTHSGIKKFYFQSFFQPPSSICGDKVQHAASTLSETREHYNCHFEQLIHGPHSGRFVKMSKDSIPSKCPVFRALTFSIPTACVDPAQVLELNQPQPHKAANHVKSIMR
jgi:pimeloyl-ACP methyl ester carboxylesterase